MEDLSVWALIIGTIWLAGKWYINRWKLNNPGKPVFERIVVDSVGSDMGEEPSSSGAASSSPGNNWLAPGGITTDYYSYSSRASDDFARNHD